MKLLGSILLAASLSASLLGCGGDDGDSGGSVKANDVAKVYAANAFESYSDSVTKAEAMKVSIDAFLATPNATTLAAARDAWKAAREPYLQTEAFRFYDGPIDNPDDGPEGEINSWPMDENFVDYVVGGDGTTVVNGGIINLTTEFPTITVDIIKSENTLGGEANISSGYHAIEFLLWGQDLSDTGPGDRPATDYVVGAGGTHMNQDRRRTYLTLVTQLLIDDLTQVRDAWAEGATYRVAFEAGGNDSIAKILLGMGSLSGAELSGERMTVAMDNRDQEDEHSCFSDNTHRDIIGDAQGLQNVFLGKYGSASNDGVGIYDLIKQKDATLADKLKAEIEDTMTKVKAIPAPFDQAIQDDANGRPKVQAGIDALQTQTATTVEVATALGITLNLE